MTPVWQGGLARLHLMSNLQYAKGLGKLEIKQAREVRWQS